MRWCRRADQEWDEAARGKLPVLVYALAPAACVSVAFFPADTYLGAGLLFTGLVRIEPGRVPLSRRSASLRSGMDAVDETAGPDVILYTDGACSGNPGPGGWAVLLRDPRTREDRELSGSDPSTTNNRMELKAVIEGVRQVKDGFEILVVSDSKYVVQGMKEWVRGWERNGWRTSDRKPVKNQDLWMELVELAKRHQVTYQWVRAHNGHPENDRVDALAVAEYQKYLR